MGVRGAWHTIKSPNQRRRLCTTCRCQARSRKPRSHDGSCSVSPQWHLAVGVGQIVWAQQQEVLCCALQFSTKLRCFKQQKHLFLAWRVGFSQRMGPWKFNALRSTSLSSAKKPFLPRSKQSRVSPRVTVPWIWKDMIICRLLFVKEGFSGISVKYNLWDIDAAFWAGHGARYLYSPDERP